MLEQFSTHGDGCQGRYEERGSNNVAWVLPLGLLGFLLLVRGDCVCLTMLLFHRFWKVGNPWKSFQHMEMVCCPSLSPVWLHWPRLREGLLQCSLCSGQHPAHVGKYVSTHGSSVGTELLGFICMEFCHPYSLNLLQILWHEMHFYCLHLNHRRFSEHI